MIKLKHYFLLILVSLFIFGCTNSSDQKDEMEIDLDLDSITQVEEEGLTGYEKTLESMNHDFALLSPSGIIPLYPSEVINMPVENSGYEIASSIVDLHELNQNDQPMEILLGGNLYSRVALSVFRDPINLEETRPTILYSTRTEPKRAFKSLSKEQYVSTSEPSYTIVRPVNLLPGDYFLQFKFDGIDQGIAIRINE